MRSKFLVTRPIEATRVNGISIWHKFSNGTSVPSSRLLTHVVWLTIVQFGYSVFAGTRTQLSSLEFTGRVHASCL